MDFSKELREKQELINSSIEELIRDNDAPPKIIEAMEYSLKAGGKRIRPILAMSVCEALGGNSNDVLPFALSIEMIHTYSLIHDDLPAMDNDDYRRGRLTNHKVFGEAMAILAGDALLNYSMEYMLKYVVENASQNYIRSAYEIAKASGIGGMIGGQVIDVESEGKNLKLDELKNMHRLKTGALIKAPCIVGCLVSGRLDKMKAVEEFGTNLGIAFQIVDDILDVVGDSAKLGKTTGKDLKEEKSTFVSLLGLQKSREMAMDYTEKAITSALELGNGEFLVKLTEFLLKRDY